MSLQAVTENLYAWWQTAQYSKIYTNYFLKKTEKATPILTTLGQDTRWANSADIEHTRPVSQKYVSPPLARKNPRTVETMVRQ